MLAVRSGLAAVLLSAPGLRLLLLAGSTAFLFYLAARIAFAGTRIAFIEARYPPGVLSAVVLQVLNPKAYAVNTALFTGFSFAPDSLWFEIGAKLLIANLIWFPLHFLWLWAGVRLHALELSQRWQRVINLGIYIGVKPIFLWRQVLPAGAGLLVGNVDFNNRLNVLKPVLPRHD